MVGKRVGHDQLTVYCHNTTVTLEHLSSFKLTLPLNCSLVITCLPPLSKTGPHRAASACLVRYHLHLGLQPGPRSVFKAAAIDAQMLPLQQWVGTKVEDRTDSYTIGLKGLFTRIEELSKAGPILVAHLPTGRACGE